ncbi:MAG: ATP-binding cassette domain-containing protein [Anaerovoracaceae bacterium]
MAIKVNIKSKLDNFNLNIAFASDTNRIGILGESGAGKSMLLKYLAGIQKADEGEIIMDDICLFDSTNKINVKPQARNIAYMFQNYALFPTMTVRENINVIAKGNKEEKIQKTSSLLRKFHIEELQDKKPGELSGGQQQRVALARIMAYEPKLILLDEPFSALDENLKEKLQIEMEEMIRDYHGMVIMVSHNRDEIYNFSKEIIVINQGEAIEYGQTRQLFHNPKTIQCGRMVGINNIMKVKVIEDSIIEIPLWNLTLDLDYKIPAGTNYIGIRDVDIEPVWKDQLEGDSEIVKIKIKSIAEKVSEKKVFFTAEAGEESHGKGEEQWSYVISKRDEENHSNLPLPTKIKVNKDKIVLFQI